MTEDELVLQPFPDAYMSPRALIGMKETREPFAESEFGTAINGDTIEVPLPWVSKYEFRLTNSGKLVAMPPRNKIKRGAVLWFESTEVDKEYVRAGFVESFVVERDLVEGSVFAHTPDGRGVKVNVSGRTVTVDRTYLDGTPVSWNEPHVEVEYRLRYLVIVTATKGFGNDRTGPSQSFGIEMVEVYAS